MSYSGYSNKWANKKKSNKHFAHQYLEKPAMYSKLPDLNGKKVLCIGCGSGEECGYLKKAGASYILGIDNSEELISIAKNSYPDLEFQNLDVQEIDFEENSYDFIFSSLTLHYLENWPELFQRLAKILKPGGRLLFSSHHPVKWGSETIRSKEFNEFKLGYKKLKDGSDKFEIYGDYLNFRRIEDKLFGELEVKYYHRSFSQMYKEITENSFKVLDIIEPKPTEESKGIKLDFYQVYSKIPLFIIFELENTKLT